MFKEKLTYIVDRIEDHCVVCESDKGAFVNIDFLRIKGSPKEGDVLVKEDNNFYVDEELTKKRREEVENLMKGMWE